MKRTILTLALVAATTAMTALAQDATPTPSPSAPPPPPQEGMGRRHQGGPGHGMLEALTPAEREQFKAARKKAEADPTVAEARKKADEAFKALREAEKAAMLKADPTIGPVLDKLAEAAKEQGPRRGGRGEKPKE